MLFEMLKRNGQMLWQLQWENFVQTQKAFQMACEMLQMACIGVRQMPFEMPFAFAQDSPVAIAIAFAHCVLAFQTASSRNL